LLNKFFCDFFNAFIHFLQLHFITSSSPLNPSNFREQTFKTDWGKETTANSSRRRSHAFSLSLFFLSHFFLSRSHFSSFFGESETVKKFSNREVNWIKWLLHTHQNSRSAITYQLGIWQFSMPDGVERLSVGGIVN
jgi:hypothetical protein